MNNLNNILNLIKNKTNHTPQPSTKPSECMVNIIYNKIQKMSLRYQRLYNLPNIAHPLFPYSSANVMLGYSGIRTQTYGSSFIL